MGDTFSCFITDDRSSVETFQLFVGGNVDAARAHAEADLRANRHHLAVEIRKGDQVVAVLKRQHLARRGPTESQPN